MLSLKACSLDQVLRDNHLWISIGTNPHTKDTTSEFAGSIRWLVDVDLLADLDVKILASSMGVNIRFLLERELRI